MPRLWRAGGPVSARSLAAKLNRHVPRGARVRLESERAFGAALELRTWRLGNGLRIHVVPDDSAPVVAYQSWFRVGSRHERQGKTGLAHFFEHLMFKGTERYPQGTLDRLLEGVGAENNAETWTDWTRYYETMPAAQLPLAIELEADRMQGLVLDEEQLESEREVVISERRDRVEDDVEGKASELLFERAFREHGYGWPTIGWMADIEGYSLSDCHAFYRTFYAPNNATLVIVGDLDEPTLLGLLQEHYGPIRRGRESTAPVAPVEPAQTRARRRQTKLPTVTEKLSLGLKAPRLGDPRWVALAVINDVLFGGRSARLVRELVLEDELATTCSGYVTPWADPGLYEIWVSLREGHRAEEAEARVWAAFERIGAEGIGEQELAKSRHRLELGAIAAMETTGGKAEQIGMDDLVVGDPVASFERLERYRTISASEVRSVARELLRKKHSTTVLVRRGAR